MWPRCLKSAALQISKQPQEMNNNIWALAYTRFIAKGSACFGATAAALAQATVMQEVCAT
jgi:hypothetical protein